MAAYMKLGDIKGESEDEGHKDWIELQSMSSPIVRQIPAGAKGHERSRGNVVLGNVFITKFVDKATPKTLEACAKGDRINEVEIHFCSKEKGKREPYLKYKLNDVIISSSQVDAHESGDTKPTEHIELNCTKIEWTYVTIGKDGSKKGELATKYDLDAGKS